MNRNRWLKYAQLTAFAVLALGLVASKALALEPIVGLWEATWTDATGGPSNGTVISNVWDVWHSDHLETQNDSGPILAGFVCQGAWTSLGKRTYFLSHPSFNYLSDGTLDTSSVTVIYEKVTVSKDGNSYQGNGEFKEYSGLYPFDPGAVMLGSPFPFNITATRVIPDTSQLP